MLKARFLSERDRKAHEAALYKVVVVCLSITTAFLGYALYKVRTYHRTILVPPQITSQIEITDTYVSDMYLRDWVYYLCALAFSYTPATARSQFIDLLRLYHPQTYPSAKDAWFELADIIEQAKITQYFQIDPRRLIFNPREKKLVVTGLRTQYKESLPIKTEVIEYTIEYAIEGGKFWIIRIGEKELPK